MSGTWVSGWVTGDIVTAAEYKKSVGMVYDTTLGGDAATMDTGATIPSGYAHMSIWVYGRSSVGATNEGVGIRFNNDSSAIYDTQLIRANATTLTGAETFAATTGNIGLLPGNTAGANLFSQIEIDVAHYAGSVNNKTYLARSAMKLGTSSGNMYVDSFAGFYRSNTAISRVAVIPASGQFKSGSRLTVYVWGA